MLHANETMRPKGAALTLRELAFTYPGGTEMRFDLHVEPSDIVAVMGPSGSGKSTMLNLIAGFEQPSSGRILIDSRDVTRLPPHQRGVSMIFQENNLFAHLTVEQNVGLGRSPSLRLSAKDREDVATAIERVGLAGKGGRLPGSLSGGERQRAALARVLVQQNPVLLLDEPLASLGPALKDEMLDLIEELHRAQRMTILMVTHDPRDARRLAQSLVFIEKGHIVATGKTEELLREGAPEALSHYLGGRSVV
ncbi:thiamine ABC transporter ATP-binding protein [Chelativorans composti]|jgi:thiamine ABC transporter, ATP-binding protein|uniref:Thiamine ABC transporter ATP-binding protein n=1 Tax=Chelativorans composti TaxID=768533 RepID=A0ABW5DE31_9HYPH